MEAVFCHFHNKSVCSRDVDILKSAFYSKQNSASAGTIHFLMILPSYVLVELRVEAFTSFNSPINANNTT